MNYDDLNEKQKQSLLIQEYETNRKSFQDIANQYNTYANKVRRDAIKLKIKIRDKSEAQSNAIKSGRTNHPTLGKQRSQKEKEKIGLSVLKSWENMDNKTIQQRKQKAKINWDKKTEDEKQNMLQQANDAVRLSGKIGSKLEKFLHKELLSKGYSVEFHKEQSILNTKLQIDLFIPKLNLAIEVDGPSHFKPVWGDDALNRNKKYDNKKTGLILGKGLYLIRIKQTKDFSKARGLVILGKLLPLLQDIENTKVVQQQKVINIGDE